MSAVLATLSGSYPPLEGRSPTCYSAVRHSPPKGCVRLACFRHAASVYPEPGSNSPSELSGTIPPYRQMASPDDLSTDRHAPHHSSIVNVPPRSSPSCRFWQPGASRPTCQYSSPERRGSRLALAPADCPTPLPAQYRWRWGVSRPCSGRERVGPPRLGHQGHALTRSSLAASRDQLVARSNGARDEVSTRGRGGTDRLMGSVSRSCRPGVVHENER
jgi:hypothetical protein